MKDDGRLNVFLHSSANLTRIEKHVRRNANLYKSKDWKEANSLLVDAYNIYILHKETKDSDTLGKLIRWRHPGALVVLVTNEPFVNQDALDKYHANYSLLEDPTRAELLSMIPCIKKLREVEGGQDTGHVADVISIHTEPSAVIREERIVSAVDLVQEALASGEIELLHKQPLEPDTAIETKPLRSTANSAISFLARLAHQPQTISVKKDTACPDYGDNGPSSSVRSYRSHLMALTSLALTLLFIIGLGLGVLARGSKKEKKEESARRVAHASKRLDSAPAVASSQLPEQAQGTPADSAPAVTSANNLASSNSPAPAPKPTPSPTPANHPSSESGDTAAATQQQPAVNHPPTAGISGPTQVTVRQTATYTASGSDQDGDGITYSWGGSTTTRCWSTPGLYTVSVTVTDSRGESAGASISVRVI